MVKRLNILRFNLAVQIAFIVFFAIQKANVFFLLTIVYSRFFNIPNPTISVIYILSSIINFSVPFLLWNVIYFGFKYFQNYKQAEIKSLKYLASSREFELNNLKSQLNPHFMFNSMNSIRALIDEDPFKAKEAVTKLSGILRNALIMNKNREIFLKEEIQLVEDYLSLEKIRYEDRLNYELIISEDVKNIKIPPFIIQSQVENAIKHGIAKLPGKGLIKIEAFKLSQVLKLKISNSGKLINATPETGVGFKNSMQRLEILYGSAGKIFISELNNLVVVDINIPLSY